MATGELRKPFFFVVVLLVLFIVLLELGSSHVVGGGSASAGFARQIQEEQDLHGVDPPSDAAVTEPPGRGISYLALIDGILLYTVGLMALGLVAPGRIQGRLQGVVTLIGSIVLIIVALILAIIALVELIVMVSLFFATPFGTIAYLALWGFFPRSDSSAILSLLMFLKLMAAVCLILAHQRFLQNKGLVLLFLTSLLASIIVAFLQGIVPIILVSITDDIAAIIVAVVAIIWGIILLIGSIPAIVKALRSTASVAQGA